MLALVSGAADPYRLIGTQRTLLYRELHSLTNQRSRPNSKWELARLLLLEKAAMQFEADLRWLELTEVRLDEIRRQPLPEPEVRPRGRPKRDTTLERWRITPQVGVDREEACHLFRPRT